MVTAKADDRKRLVVPQAKPGQVYAILDNPDGTITLSPMQPKGRKASILDGLKPMTKEECARCWGPEADDAENDRIAEAMSKAPAPDPSDLE